MPDTNINKMKEIRTSTDKNAKKGAKKKLKKGAKMSKKGHKNVQKAQKMWILTKIKSNAQPMQTMKRHV